jgi:bifunctional non-homologous end joining protein LigD
LRPESLRVASSEIDSAEEEAVAREQRVTVNVDGRRLTLSNLTKVLYPETGFTKGEVIDYYTRIAPVLLPHVDARPATRKRYPDGVDGQSFFEKNAPSG